MSESNLEMTEAINGNVKQTNAIANGGLKVLGAASGLEMSITVNQTTAVIQDIAAGGTGGGSGSASVDLSFVTATAADILSGKVSADASGNPVNGAIKTVTASLSGNVVTVPAGFIAKDQTLTVPKAGAEFFRCVSVDLGKPYIIVSGAGTPECNGTYVLKDGSSNVYKNTKNHYELTVNNSSGSYYDTEVVMTIGYYDDIYMMEFNMYNGTYLSSVGGIRWEPNGGEMPVPTVSEIYPTTGQPVWSGHKAVLTNGEYTFEDNVTTGLTYSLIVPENGKVYTADALVTVGYIYAGMPTPYVDWAMNSYSGTVNGESWNFMQGFYGNHEFSPDGVTFSGDGYVNLDGLTTDLLQGDFTVALEVNQTSTDRTAYFAANDDCYIGIDDNQGNYNLWAGDGGWNILQSDSSGYDNSGNGSIARENNKDVKLVYVHSGTVWKLYVNGALSVEKNRSGNIRAGNTLRLAAWGGGGMKFAGKMRNFKLFREALPEALIKQL